MELKGRREGDPPDFPTNRTGGGLLAALGRQSVLDQTGSLSR